MTSKEALERLKDDIEINYLSTKHSNEKDKSNYIGLLNSIEKDLEILEILKNKTVAIFLIPNCQSAYDYSMKTIGFKSLTDKEFMLIKEWLENE